jgi:signal transduction histidine kinase
MRAAWSFRARIFAVTALTVVAVLGAATALGWSRVVDYEMERLDDRLCGESRRLANQPPRTGRGLARLEDDLVPKLRLKGPEQLLLQLAAPGEPARRSAAWPPALDPGALGWQAAPGGGGRPRPGGPPPRREADATVATPAGDPSAQRGAGRESARDAGRESARDAGRDAGRESEGPAEQRADAPGSAPPPAYGSPSSDRPPPGRRPGGEGPPPLCELASFTVAGAPWRAARTVLPWSGAVVAADLAAPRADMLAALQTAAAVVLPLALLLTGGGAWLLSGLALRPVARLRTAMSGMDRGALDQRLPSAREDREFRELIAAYNTMLDRLEASFHQASRFSADAAHELKTPLTILRGQLERAIAASENQAIQVHLGEMLDEVGRLAGITRKLLLLSQADAGRLALLRAPVDLSALLAECVADLQLSGAGLQVTSHVPPGLALQADAQLLRQLLNNLGSNALKYTPAAGWVRVHARALADAVEVCVENAAPTLTQADRARFFERFFRGDAAHNRRVDGHGLGLSLAREIARAHGGELTLADSNPKVVVMCLRLPLGAGVSAPAGGPASNAAVNAAAKGVVGPAAGPADEPTAQPSRRPEG